MGTLPCRAWVRAGERRGGRPVKTNRRSSGASKETAGPRTQGTAFPLTHHANGVVGSTHPDTKKGLSLDSSPPFGSLCAARQP